MVQVSQDFKSICFKGSSRCLTFFWQLDILVNHLSIYNDTYTICVKETTFQINNCFTIPVHDKIWFFSHGCNDNSINIFFVTCCNEGIYIFWTNHHGHTFLRFRDGNFGTIQALVFQWHFVKINFKTICQFTNSHTDTTSSKVI